MICLPHQNTSPVIFRVCLFCSLLYPQCFHLDLARGKPSTPIYWKNQGGTYGEVHFFWILSFGRTFGNPPTASWSSQPFPPRDWRQRNQDRDPEEGGVLLNHWCHLQSFWPRELLEPLPVIYEFHKKKNAFQAAEKHLKILIKPSAMGNGTFMHTDFGFSSLFFLSTAGKEARTKRGFQLSSLTRNLSFSGLFFFFFFLL